MTLTLTLNLSHHYPPVSDGWLAGGCDNDNSGVSFFVFSNLKTYQQIKDVDFTDRAFSIYVVVVDVFIFCQLIWSILNYKEMYSRWLKNNDQDGFDMERIWDYNWFDLFFLFGLPFYLDSYIVLFLVLA